MFISMRLAMTSRFLANGLLSGLLCILSVAVSARDVIDVPSKLESPTRTLQFETYSLFHYAASTGNSS